MEVLCGPTQTAMKPVYGKSAEGLQSGPKIFRSILPHATVGLVKARPINGKRTGPQLLCVSLHVISRVSLLD